MKNEVKEAAPKYNYISPQEYLETERASQHRSEYYDGHILAMSGASLSYNMIESNLVGNLFSFLEGSHCRVLPSNMRVSTPSSDAYMYPDVTIVCGEPQLEDNQFDTLLNPAVIIEILSPSTSSMDKGRKFFFYKEIPSLQEYIMIDSVKQYIIIARRQADNSWIFENLDANSAELYIQTIAFSLTLQKIYNGTGI
ncbi:MAG: Uma2 family endonuclease [Chitinophagaceae bacterium]|nr:Uma2 family endonuclease [Chitinophagaceae bacterium]